MPSCRPSLFGLLALMLSCCCGPSPCEADLVTYNVPTDITTFSTTVNGYTYSSTNDYLIILPAGTYMGCGTTLAFDENRVKSITFRGLIDGVEVATIDCNLLDMTAPLFAVSSNGIMAFEDIEFTTFDHIHGPNNIATFVAMSSGASVVMTRVNIQYFQVATNRVGSPVPATGVDFSYNIKVVDSFLAIEDSLIEFLYSDSGAIFVGSGGKLNVSNSFFVSNTADDYWDSPDLSSGGVFSFGTGSTAYISNSTFEGNEADLRGGSFAAYTGSYVVFEDCYVTALGGTPSGDFGAVIGPGAVLIVRSCTFSGSVQNGLFIVEDGEVHLTNILVESLTCHDDGGLVKSTGASQVTVLDSSVNQITSTGAGGVFSFHGGTLTVSGLNVSNMDVLEGGIAYFEGAAADAEFSDCFFETITVVNGGLVSMSGTAGGTNIEIVDSVIDDVTATGAGGLIYANGLAHVVQLSDCRVFTVSAVTGAVIDFSGLTSSMSLSVTNTRMKYVTADTDHLFTLQGTMTVEIDDLRLWDHQGVIFAVVSNAPSMSVSDLYVCSTDTSEYIQCTGSCSNIAFLNVVKKCPTSPPLLCSGDCTQMNVEIIPVNATENFFSSSSSSLTSSSSTSVSSSSTSSSSSSTSVSSSSTSSSSSSTSVSSSSTSSSSSSTSVPSFTSSSSSTTASNVTSSSSTSVSSSEPASSTGSGDSIERNGDARRRRATIAAAVTSVIVFMAFLLALLVYLVKPKNKVTPSAGPGGQPVVSDESPSAATTAKK